MRPSVKILSTWAIITSIALSPTTAQDQRPASQSSPPQVPRDQASNVSRSVAIRAGRDDILTSASRSVAISTPRLPVEDTGNILIPSPNADPNRMGELTSDLLVMCRIFDKTVGRAYVPDMMPGMHMEGMYDMYGSGMEYYPLLGPRGVLDRFFNPHAPETKALYIQGYGAVFTIGVRFPLKAPVEPKTETTTAKPADPFWTETRQEIFEPHRVREDSDAPHYQPQAVDRLRRQIKDAMRYCANIRGMAPDEYVTVVVHGSEKTAYGPSLPIATLTLRVRKRDADAQAAAGIDAKLFDAKIECIDF